jgi:hypothetical protein
MKQIILTEEEQKVLLNIIDVAVKATGLNGAQAGLVLAKKISEATNVPEKVTE